jgi:signal transduction histidine kinase
VATEWRELGWVGRVGLGGIAVALVLTVALGFFIVESSRRHLLDGRTDLMRTITADLADRGVIPEAIGSAAGLERLEEEVNLRLLGGETVRVKLWTADGTIAYSSGGDLTGQEFELSDLAELAFAGEAVSGISTLDEDAHALERDLGRLIEFYVPIFGESGEVTAVFEVEQLTDTLDRQLSDIRLNTWLSIGLGLGVLSVFMGSLTLAGARAIDRRRRQAERLLGELLRTQDAERKRIVGSLHDDVGQPLYRLLYGLEGSRVKLSDDDPVRQELATMEGLVRDVDRTLREELRLLHRSDADDLGIRAALAELVETVRNESDLDIELRLDTGPLAVGLGPSVLFRAAEEALINVRKHAGAASVRVRLTEAENRLTLEVVDDGRGYDHKVGLGLTTNRERLEAAGGGLRLSKGRGGGTVLHAWVPLGRGR